ncbi:MAG: hypothetical protein OHK93_007137 [Ramalina farinacea]|uniref:Alcohol dehydrogenase-like C-terminal domain-containing protein n=1 Tax=Ramalina farinacea TaxID=258253 RepID=A0AA43QM40_9LECA|nr:hypothetical protein [Ramalina farinacea]
MIRPRIPGHETIGDVVVVGEGEKKWKVGDRVGAPWHGGHDDQEYVILRTEAVVKVPASLDPAEFAPFLCAGVTVYNSIQRMQLTPGALVGIQGLGGLGHMAVQYASKMGYRVIALSSSASKEKFAKDLGAAEYVDGSKTKHAEALQVMGGADLIVATAPNPELIPGLLGGLMPGGKLLILSRECAIQNIKVWGNTGLTKRQHAEM